MGMIDMTEGEADYLKYRFKQWLGSVARAIQNRRLKEQEMKMSIEESINGVEKRILPIYDNDADHQALVTAIDTMRKYQKIAEIVDKWNEGIYDDEGLSHTEVMELVSDEVYEDGNDD